MKQQDFNKDYVRVISNYFKVLKCSRNKLLNRDLNILIALEVEKIVSILVDNWRKKSIMVTIDNHYFLTAKLRKRSIQGSH